jgi:hypothetical protein
MEIQPIRAHDHGSSKQGEREDIYTFRIRPNKQHDIRINNQSSMVLSITVKGVEENQASYRRFHDQEAQFVSLAVDGQRVELLGRVRSRWILKGRQG